MVALAARSLGDLGSDVTLPQYRALVVLASRGPQRVVDISNELGVNPSTGTRMCDRLTRKNLIRRYRATGDRREVRLVLTPGRARSRPGGEPPPPRGAGARRRGHARCLAPAGGRGAALAGGGGRRTAGA